MSPSTDPHPTAGPHPATPSTTRGPDRAGPVLLAFGAVQLGLALFIVVAPGAFADTIGSFGERNDHLARDIATFYLALGVLLVGAASRPGWRVPAIVAAGVQYVAHVLNHVWDIGDADPGWIGPADVVVLVAGAVLLAWLWREVTSPTPGATRPGGRP